jgi:hypothetical protein
VYIFLRIEPANKNAALTRLGAFSQSALVKLGAKKTIGKDRQKSALVVT